MIIWIITSICFIFLISRFLPRNNILLLNFYFYIIFSIIILFQRYLELLLWFDTDKWLKFDKYIIIFSISISLLLIIYCWTLFFKNIRNKISRHFIILCHLIVSFGIILFFWVYRDLLNTSNYTTILKVYSDLDLNFLFIYILIIYLVLLYFLSYFTNKIFVLKNYSFKFTFSKLKIKNIFNKLLYIFRDIFVIWLFVFSSILIADINLLYSKYYNRYKNPEYFTNQIYVCEDDTKMILEQHYRHHPIINPYDSFFDFYNYYAEKHGQLDYEINELHPDKINKQYLGKCISQNGNNYFDEYVRIHGTQPRNYIIKYR